MMKSVCLLTRRQDLSREAFHDYYETRHAPLAIGYFPFEKYVRSHLQDHADLGFDTVSEFWAEDLAALTSLMEGEVGEILRADERKFMDQSQIRPGGAEELLLLGPPREVDAPQARTALLVERASGVSDQAFRQALRRWAQVLADVAKRIAVDLVSPWSQRGFVGEAILWLWGAQAVSAQPPAEVRLLHVLAVRTAETPSADLLPHRSGGRASG
jgi:hypothetical protein